MGTSKYNSPPLLDAPDFHDWCVEIHYRVADDPGDSTATTLSELVAEYNTLLANLRTAGLIK